LSIVRPRPTLRRSEQEIRNPKSEGRKKAEIRNPNSAFLRPSDFGLRISSASRGFTLIEAILALAISAIVLAAIGGVFAGALRLRDRTSDAVEASLPLTQTLDVLRRDLQGTVGPSNVLAGDFKCGSQDMGENMELGSSGGPGVDFFTTTGVVNDDAPWGDIQEVYYQLAPSADHTPGGQDLVRYVNRNLLASGTAAPEKQNLMSNVKTVQFDCYDGTQWRNNWDTSQGDTNLPIAVRVSISMSAPGGGVLQPVLMVVPLVTQSRMNTNAVAATAAGGTP
jgi:type II secretion system protein J